MITFKEEFVDCDKWRRAVRLGGSDAIVLWVCLKAHAGKHLTDGFISDEDLETLPGAPVRVGKALRALIECGRLNPDGSRGAGLVERVLNGHQLHDYLEHAESRERLLQRRELAASRKRRERGGDPVTHPVTRDIQRDEPRDECDPDPVRHAPVPRGRADVPSPAQPRQTQPSGITAAADSEDLTGSARAAEPEPGCDGGSGKTPMSFDSAIRMPIAERAKACLALGPTAGGYLEPHRWPEVSYLFAAFCEAAKRSGRLLGTYDRDPGLRALVGLLADGHPPTKLEQDIRAVCESRWWREGGSKRDLQSITPTVIGRAGEHEPASANGRRGADLVARVARLEAEEAAAAKAEGAA